MTFKDIISQLNLHDQCKKYGLPIWQCPQFLFLIMGIVVISSSIITYAIGGKYIKDPEEVALAVLVITTFLFTISFVIIRGFERLAEANRLKSEFVSIVSHQLRSPLSNLKWVIELLMSGRIDLDHKKTLEYFDLLKENNNRMTELVSDLLIVSKIEEGKVFLKKEKACCRKLIEKVIKNTCPVAEACTVRLKFKADKSVPKIFIDTPQIRLVVENLIDNAIRYSNGNGVVEVKLEEKAGNLYFEVKDSGVGIPNEDKKHIFQKFFRSSNASRHKTEGSGLGLYIAKSIIEKSGGKVGFKSQENIGSTFWFTLPIKN